MNLKDAVKLTAYVSDSVRYEHKPLYEAILELLHHEGISGATVAHGTAGYGADKQLHTIKILRLSNDLPVIVTAIDTREKIDAVLPKLDTMIAKGLVTIEDVTIVFHRPES